MTPDALPILFSFLIFPLRLQSNLGMIFLEHFAEKPLNLIAAQFVLRPFCIFVKDFRAV